MTIRSIFKKLLLLTLPLFSMVACNEPDPDSIAVVDANGELLSHYIADAAGEEIAINVVGEDWTASSSAYWCEPQKSQGSTNEATSLVVDPIVGENREATVTFKSGDAVHYLVVKQTAQTELIEILPSATAVVDHASQTLQFTVNSNITWNYQHTTDEWMKVYVVNGILNVVLEENESSDSRSAEVVVYAEDGLASATISITQTGISDASLSVMPSQTQFEATETVATATAYSTISDATYTASVNSSWVSVEMNGNVLTYTVAANTSAESRQATVTVRATSASNSAIYETAEFELTQKGLYDPYIYIFANDIVLSNEQGSTATISSIANGTLQAGSDSQWLSVSTNSNNEITFTAATANTTGTARTAVVTVIATLDGQTSAATLNVHQNGQGTIALEVSPENIEVEAAATTYEISAVTSDHNGDLVYRSSASWCEVSTSGKLTIAANTTIYDRECYITVSFTVGDEVVYKSVKVTQKGI